MTSPPPTPAPPDVAALARRIPPLVRFGASSWNYPGWRGLVYHLAVAPAFRSMGVGSRLMDELEARLRAKGCLKCYLLVTGDNPEAEVYYQHRGWQHMDAIRLYGKELQ